MKILILGGTGAMGTSLVDILGKTSNDIYVTSRSEHISKNKNIHYLKGNSHHDDFIDRLLKENYDAIVDFMVYNTDEFMGRVDRLLSATNQYVFLSSARVYANSKNKITEKSARLLDTIKDEEYLKTDEYALTKARQENILTNSGKKNWTIIRPYITYSNERLQLGVYEKEAWLYRALKGKPVVFSKDIASKYTTLTYGKDVSVEIANLLGKLEALGECFHITTQESKKWGDILNIYLDVIEEQTGKRSKVVMIDNAIQNTYQVKYDRLFNRVFSNEKTVNATHSNFRYTNIELGLKRCLTEFIEEKHEFKNINWKIEAKNDKMAKYKTPLNEITGGKKKVEYVIYRYFIVLILVAKKMKRLIKRT